MDAADSGPGGAWKALRAGPEAAGVRLDQFLAGAGFGLSRTRAQALIRAGHVLLDGTSAKEPKSVLRGGETVSVAMPEAEAAEPQPENIPLDILFEDEHLIVIDKPPGLVVHPGAGNWTGTLVNALIHHCGASLSGIGGVRRPGIVHRLDKDTSGVMVVAKNDAAHAALSEAFADHGRSGGLEREYLALVWGAPERRSGAVDAPVGRSAGDRVRQAILPAEAPGARHAVTHYSLVERLAVQRGEAQAALLACRLETGRTHQIRVHMAHIGCPVIGDRDYGAGFRTKANRLPEPARSLTQAFPRQALHAARLGFRHPATGERLRFETPPPPDMAALIEALRRV
jgi:23S rRNA pseudouridine1911/1915/1917 synthase